MRKGIRWGGLEYSQPGKEEYERPASFFFDWGRCLNSKAASPRGMRHRNALPKACRLTDKAARLGQKSGGALPTTSLAGTFRTISSEETATGRWPAVSPSLNTSIYTAINAVLHSTSDQIKILPGIGGLMSELQHATKSVHSPGTERASITQPIKNSKAMKRLQ